MHISNINIITTENNKVPIFITTIIFCMSELQTYSEIYVIDKQYVTFFCSAVPGTF